MDHIHTAWGDEIARLEFRPAWKGVSSPWRHLAKLLPGQSWFELPEPDIESQSQVYVVQKETPPIPPEAMAAMDLVAQGATDAFVIENWLGIGIMNHKLVGAKTEPRITDLIETYKTASGKKNAPGASLTLWPSGQIRACQSAK